MNDESKNNLSSSPQVKKPKQQHQARLDKKCNLTYDLDQVVSSCCKAKEYKHLSVSTKRRPFRSSPQMAAS